MIEIVLNLPLILRNLKNIMATTTANNIKTTTAKSTTAMVLNQYRDKKVLPCHQNKHSETCLSSEVLN